jgi:glycosyltransferase involved in cell wall biosynthesis
VKIAVDLTPTSGSINGIRRYVDQTLRAAMTNMAFHVSDTRWIGYTNAKVIATIPTLSIRSSQLPGLGGKVLTQALHESLWARSDQPDVFWAPAQRIPLFLPPKTRVVVTVHDLCAWHAPDTMRSTTRTLDRLLLPRALQRADTIIAVSKSTAEGLRKQFPALRAEIRVIHEAASELPTPQEASSLRMLGINEKFVLCVGTIEPRKNYASLINAWRLLPDSLRNTHQLVIVGRSGWGGIDVRTLAVASNVSESVLWLSSVGDEQLSTLYAHAKCLAMPSLYEGFGLPVVEAMAYGTPVVVSTDSALTEIAGDAALSADPRQPAEFANALTTLLGNDEVRRSLGDAAQRRSHQFSWHRTGKETALALLGRSI